MTHPEVLTTHLTTNKVVVVTNDVVEPLYFPIVSQALAGYDVSKIVVPDGEQHKNLQSFEMVISKLVGNVCRA
ncbi:hypothetical protein [uncultured Paraglaciecola sp.]|uniref:hypothetical protein n=1 Tax=uncultured Paraglaciecola sp. TaxID=1765024 RepID=UPI00345833DD